MFVIYEKTYSESCGGGASVTHDERYILTENTGYPQCSQSELHEPDQDNSSVWCIDRKVCGEFASAEEARKYVLAFEGGSYLGADIARQVEKYPDTAYKCVDSSSQN